MRQVHNLEWQKMAKCGKLAVVWCVCAKNRILIRSPVKAVSSVPTLTHTQNLTQFLFVVCACRLLWLSCFHLYTFFPSYCLFLLWQNKYFSFTLGVFFKIRISKELVWIYQNFAYAGFGFKGFPVLNCCFNFMNNEEICFLPMPISIAYWPMQRTHIQKNRANSYSEKKLRVSWGLNLWRSVRTKARCWRFIQLSSHILVLGTLNIIVL